MGVVSSVVQVPLHLVELLLFLKEDLVGSAALGKVLVFFLLRALLVPRGQLLPLLHVKVNVNLFLLHRFVLCCSHSVIVTRGLPLVFLLIHIAVVLVEVTLHLHRLSLAFLLRGTALLSLLVDGFDLRGVVRVVLRGVRLGLLLRADLEELHLRGHVRAVLAQVVLLEVLRALPAQRLLPV